MAGGQAVLNTVGGRNEPQYTGIELQLHDPGDMLRPN